MERIVFLSPHPTDAIFSCPALIQRLVTDKKEVTIVNVFTRGLDERNQEEPQAAHFLKVKTIGLDFEEAASDPYFRKLGDESGTLQNIVDSFRKISADQIYVPLGVGWHIDHLLVFEAARKAFEPSQLFFYEDSPYKGVKHQTALRLGKNGPEKWEEYIHHWLLARYVRHSSGQWNHEKVLSFTKNPETAPVLNPAPSLCLEINLRRHEQNVARQAIEFFASQKAIWYLEGHERYYRFS